jgi:hypothetical protein
VGKSAKSAARRDRLEAALRENLKRRKARDKALASAMAPDDASAADLPRGGLDKANRLDQINGR